jgi:hypothetical protein
MGGNDARIKPQGKQPTRPVMGTGTGFHRNQTLGRQLHTPCEKFVYRDFPRSQAPVVDYFFLGDGIFYIGVK